MGFTSFREIVERKTNSQGFSAISLTIFLNLFVVTILFGLASVYQLAQEEDSAFTICMTQVWRAQEEHRKILDKLLLLNTTADKLIQARIQAEARLVVAVSSGNAPGIAAAKARLSIVRARQAVLRTKQQALLWSADFTATNFNSSVRHNIQRDLLIKNFELDEMKLAIFATPAQEIAPRYELQEPFRQRQSAGGQWTVKGLRGSCFATLEKRGQKWFVRMIADKS